MLFIALGKAKAGTPQERIARRAQWQFPEGLRLVAEYWTLGGEYDVISVLEGESASALMASLSAWSDVMDFKVTPAVTIEEGLRFSQGIMGKAG